MKKVFEPPALCIICFNTEDILTASPNWDLPEVTNGPTEPTNPSGWELPIYP